MKKVKRILIVLLVVTMMISSSTVAFAAEENPKREGFETTMINEDVLKAQYPTVSGTIRPENNFGTLKLYPHADQGGSLKLRISTSCASSSGAIIITLYNPNANIVSHDWIMGPNDEALFELPMFAEFGTYTLELNAQGITQSVSVSAYLRN